MYENLKCGLLGRKLGHTFSPLIHKMTADYSYDLFEKEPEEVADFLKNGDYDAINVTIPYKIDAFNACDVLSDEARRIGAVNTVVKRNGVLFGYNTDFFGFKYMLESAGVSAENKKCVVLGSGGASKTVVAALKSSGAREITVISRRGESNYETLYERHGDTEVIINTTPVGMYPNVNEAPIDVKRFKKCIFVGDVIYNPSSTRLLYEARECGIKTANGLGMLVAQGVKASAFFTDSEMREELVSSICNEVERQTSNIVLIGMPGSGKSSVGKAIAKTLGREFIDIDNEIEARTGRLIPEIFAMDGESYFRNIESEITADICKRSGLVIATGGGVVTRPENRFYLKCNGTVIYVKRSLEELAVNGRPLSQSRGVAVLFKERRPLYESWADGVAVNGTTVGACAEECIKICFEQGVL